MVTSDFSQLFQIVFPIFKIQHKKPVCNFQKSKINLKNMKKTTSLHISSNTKFLLEKAPLHHVVSPLHGVVANELNIL